MLDFSGWADNLSISGGTSGDVPAWLLALGVGSAAAGGATLAVAWLPASGAHFAGVIALLVAALLIEMKIGECELRNALLGLGHALGLGGALNAAARYVPEPAVSESFGLVAPFVAVLSAPLLLRIWHATLFSVDTIKGLEEGRARVRAAMAREPTEPMPEGAELVVRIESMQGDEINLVICSDAGERPARAHASALGDTRWLRPNGYFLLVQPALEFERAAGGSYRDATDILRILSVKSVQWARSDPQSTSDFGLSNEVRAGAVVMALQHALVAAIAYWLARAIA
jgi:hypothetical protein